MSTAELTAQDAELPQDLVDTFIDMAAHEHHPRGAAIEALRLVQERFGWINDAHLAHTARILGMSQADLDGIATYFNLLFRKPVGKNVVMLCDSVSCYIMGAEQTRERLCKKLGVKMGETTPDGEFTVLPIVCSVIATTPRPCWSERIFSVLSARKTLTASSTTFGRGRSDDRSQPRKAAASGARQSRDAARPGRL
ncbi:NADH-quinone oxidoreductase subunit NuoE [Asaia platycodi]|uniref:NADH-quinone oxidoreductase subunit NuoE n=1 Tax=Asaia platycodi TaxID=610243 RepID=UPI000AA34705|nr:NADH-quinone oxidoreductase subunit NuoE [Asaia platycodi]